MNKLKLIALALLTSLSALAEGSGFYKIVDVEGVTHATDLVTYFDAGAGTQGQWKQAVRTWTYGTSTYGKAHKAATAYYVGYNSWLNDTPVYSGVWVNQPVTCYFETVWYEDYTYTSMTPFGVPYHITESVRHTGVSSVVKYYTIVDPLTGPLSLWPGGVFEKP
jgi:hypothetical protein